MLIRELGKGCAFDGWCEGTLNFPPTYKYELNSEKYRGEDPKVGRRVPSWCDRILSFGNGLRLFSYRRAELRLSNHRPVTASYMVEVEVFCPRKLQRALTLTDAEIKNQEVVTDNGIDVGLSTEDWERHCNWGKMQVLLMASLVDKDVRCVCDPILCTK
ncbi:Type IV inositol polyphosphate 5-phosphatase 3 [Camellia lanceoleosa]|uniref:Type IV inositol polyphosphate 5-phosphatase 3 n=1 Tax=Camellia lanceoleosa TaxID=1840588 RepID=A0ACC0G527_9ERIC|nr:Type IV inositol polyphosphate 5-phosphatase 3 [Camellia lanceoleosa]